ncbi:MAG: hypothetical protein HOP27_13305 [Anaerolineales bacterium]|nr:hypothetical protein [Anaerolineales bacterium]
MEKKSLSRSEDLKPVKLYLDDLEKIVSILRTESAEVSIETREYKYESLEELARNRKDTIYELKLKSRYVTLTFTEYSAELYILNDEDKLRGIFEKIKEIVVKRERNYRKIVSTSWSWVFWILGAILFIGKFLPSSINNSLALIFLIPALVINIWLYLEQNKYSIIILSYHTDQSSFWKQNRNNILMLIIGAGVTAFVATLFEVVKNFLNNK